SKSVPANKPVRADQRAFAPALVAAFFLAAERPGVSRPIGAGSDAGLCSAGDAFGAAGGTRRTGAVRHLAAAGPPVDPGLLHRLLVAGAGHSAHRRAESSARCRPNDRSEEHTSELQSREK